jgi:threonine dehydrogenase-like Zn-dependent dehydrogenase
VFTEPLAAALQIREQVEIDATERVLVVGDGKLGLLVARALASTGASLCVAGHHVDKLALLAGQGIETLAVREMSKEQIERVLRDFDLAIECTGNPAGFATARRALRPRGTLAMKSTFVGSLTVDPSSLVVDEITLVGSRCGPFAPALELLASGAVRVADLVADSFPLSEGLAAFEAARRPGTLKVLLEVA